MRALFHALFFRPFVRPTCLPRPARRRRALRLPLQTCLKDLRSQLVREACALLVCIARACNGADGLPVGHVSRDGGRQCLRDAVPTLLEGLSSGNRLNARFVDDCLLALIKLCRFKQFVGAVAEYATPARRGRSAAVGIPTTGLGGPHQTSELSSSVKSKSIRLIFGRIDCSRRVLEVRPKIPVQIVRVRAH